MGVVPVTVDKSGEDHLPMAGHGLDTMVHGEDCRSTPPPLHPPPLNNTNKVISSFQFSKFKCFYIVRKIHLHAYYVSRYLEHNEYSYIIFILGRH